MASELSAVPFDLETRTTVEVDQILAGKPRAPVLVVISGNAEGKIVTGQSFPLRGEMVIGRGPVDISLEMEGVSRRHALARVRPDGSVEVEDLGSTNGTLLNGLRVDRAVIQDGDRLSFGSALLVKVSAQVADEPKSAPARSPSDWAPHSWRELEASHQPPYDDWDEVDAVLARLKMLPPLVAYGEVMQLKSQIAEAACGKRFILQGGDCAERFGDCRSQAILRKIKILSQMSLVLTYGARRPVTLVGRIAGQYAKPRSNSVEVVDGVEMPVYLGDNINDLEATPAARRPDPSRMERGYFLASATLNFIRALHRAGFADLRSPEHWQLDFIPDTGVHANYREIANRISDAMDYLASVGHGAESFRGGEFFVSHEGLLLDYEESLTRRSRNGGPYFNLGAHLLWIGDRTRRLDGAHVEYFRGIANPIGIKIGPSCTPEELVELVVKLDPAKEPGRLTVVTRMGTAHVEEYLPKLIRALQNAGRDHVAWACDPMHGNTHTVNGLKTRDYQDIVTELTATYEIHRAEHSALAGVHFELTGDDVTECLGGVVGLSADDLCRFYKTGCDPRLNYAQSMEIAFLLAGLLQSGRLKPRGCPEKS